MNRISLAVVLILVPAFVRADDPPSAPAGPPPTGADHKEPETELGGKMGKMNGAFRKLRRQAGDATKNAESLQLVATLRENAEAAAKLVPAKADSIPEADRAKWIEGYKSKMAEMIEAIGKLEAAFKADNNEEAVKIVQSLGALQKDGHGEYRKKEH